MWGYFKKTQAPEPEQKVERQPKIHKGYTQPGASATFLHNYIMDGGQYEGQSITRVPTQYLKHAMDKFPLDERKKKIFEMEIYRRGNEKPEVYVTLHAINRYSELFINQYVKYRRDRENIGHFISVLAQEAIDKGSTRENESPRHDSYYYQGKLFVFDTSNENPKLVTIS